MVKKLDGYDSILDKLNAHDTSLAEISSNFVSPLKFGIKSSNDTSIIQQALNSLNDGDTFILPYGTYNVTNIVIPDKSNITLIFYGTLKAIVGGDTDYLMATYKYINNIPEAGLPVRLVTPKIDGSNLVTNGLVIQSWNTTIEKPEIFNCVNGLKMTAQTKNGTNFGASTLVNNVIDTPKIHANTGIGLWVNDPSRNKITDYTIQGGYVYSNTGVGISLDSCAGTLFKGVHTYGNNQGIVVAIGSLAFRIHDCYFEESDSIKIWDFNTNIFVSLMGNTINGKVFSYASNTNCGIKGNGNVFRTSNGKYIQQWGNSFITSTGDVFEASDPYTNVGGDGTTPSGSAPNKTSAQNCFSIAYPTEIIQGIQKNNVVTKITM